MATFVNDTNNFELDFEQGKIRVQRHSLSGQVIYRILFSDQRPALVVTRALHANANNFWTSIPEGRQVEAEMVGPAIAEYIQSLQ
jgi:hypothetical protein